MIKSLFNLRSFLRLSPEQLRILMNDCKYRVQRVPKKKYGEVQKYPFGEIKKRDVMVPEHLLKKIQQRIHKLLSQIPLPAFMNGGIAKRNHIINASYHLNQAYFLTIDLKDYFKKIDHHRVYRMFLEIGCSTGVAHTLTKLTTVNGGLPQGAPSSSVIASLVFLNTAIELNEFACINGLRFSSFVDDHTFSSKKDFQGLVPQILRILRKNRFYPCNKKIHYRKGFCEITGLYVKENQLSVRHKMKNRAKQISGLKRYVDFVEGLVKSNKAVGHPQIEAHSYQ